MQALDSSGTLIEDVPIDGGSAWTAKDHIGWAVASYDGKHVFFVTTDSHSIYSIDIQAPHTVCGSCLREHHSNACTVAFGRRLQTIADILSSVEAN